jgi:hypothetical protein
LETKLLRITAPHFVAGAIWVNKECTEAAPIIKWMVGKPPLEVKAYLDKRKWKYEWIPYC